MKKGAREQFICVIFAVILFLSGMCVEIPPAGASFLRAQKYSANQTTGSVISEGTKMATLESVCTLDMLRRDTTTYLSGNRGRNFVKRIFKTVYRVSEKQIFAVSQICCLAKAFL